MEEEKKEIIEEEIYEYYKDKNGGEEDFTAEENVLEEKQEMADVSEKQLIKPLDKMRLPKAFLIIRDKLQFAWNFIKKRFSYFFAFIKSKIKEILADRKKRLIIYGACAFVASCVFGALIGCIIPKNAEKTAEIKERLQEENKDYLKAYRTNNRLNRRVDELYEERAELKAELNSITDYEEMRDKTTDKYEELSEKMNAAEKEIDEKQTEIDGLNSEIALSGGGKITLTPGMYTVGKHIAVGEYSVTGKGSLLVSDKDSKLKINTKLSSAGYKCGLSEGDTIKIEASAAFNPEN